MTGMHVLSLFVIPPSALLSKVYRGCITDSPIIISNYPLPTNGIHKPNSEGVIGGNYTQMRDLVSRIESESKNADIFSVSRADLVDSGSLPTLIMQFAISSMNQIDETAKDIIEEERKNFIVSFVTAFLMSIPVVGKTVGALSATSLRTIVNVGGELGCVAIGIYGVVDDPDNVFLNLFGLLFGGEIAAFQGNLRLQARH